MSKFLLFACVALCGILAVRSNPRRRSVDPDTKSLLPSPTEQDPAKTNDSSCYCSLNATSFGSMLQPPNILQIQNILPSTSVSASVFEWKCNLVPSKVVRDDYHNSPGIGAHKLHTRGKVWNEARKICIEEGGHLAIINSHAEAKALVDLYKRSSPFKDSTDKNQMFLGIHDLYTEGDWVTVEGDSLEKTGYAAWSDKWGGQPDNGGGVQNCGTMIDDGTLDDVSCSLPYAFFCEINA